MAQYRSPRPTGTEIFMTETLPQITSLITDYRKWEQQAKIDSAKQVALQQNKDRAHNLALRKQGEIESENDRKEREAESNRFISYLDQFDNPNAKLSLLGGMIESVGDSPGKYPDNFLQDLLNTKSGLEADKGVNANAEKAFDAYEASITSARRTGQPPITIDSVVQQYGLDLSRDADKDTYTLMKDSRTRYLADRDAWIESVTAQVRAINLFKDKFGNIPQSRTHLVDKLWNDVKSNLGTNTYINIGQGDEAQTIAIPKGASREDLEKILGIGGTSPDKPEVSYSIEDYDPTLFKGGFNLPFIPAETGPPPDPAPNYLDLRGDRNQGADVYETNNGMFYDIGSDGSLVAVGKVHSEEEARAIWNKGYQPYTKEAAPPDSVAKAPLTMADPVDSLITAGVDSARKETPLMVPPNVSYADVNLDPDTDKVNLTYTGEGRMKGKKVNLTQEQWKVLADDREFKVTISKAERDKIINQLARKFKVRAVEIRKMIFNQYATSK